MWKDPIIVPVGKYKYSTTFGDMMVIAAIKDLWERTTSMTEVMNAEKGL